MKKNLLFFFLVSHVMYGQLEFCEGSKGDPIFTIDFFSGFTHSPTIGQTGGTTTYTYVEDQVPFDGEYTIIDKFDDWFNWHDFSKDHTPNDISGNMLVVNADDNNAGEFYRTSVSGLCENTTYEFSAWITNVSSSINSPCSGGGIPINVRFEILDETNTNVLAAGSTGDINEGSTIKWEQYGLTFTTEPGQGEVILVMLNNGVGGCGNDLAIDDIVFRSCGDLTTISSNLTQDEEFNICQDQGPVNIDLMATAELSVYPFPVYQWQENSDGVNWNDIPFETSNTYSATNITSDTYFRVKVAESISNLNNDNCNSASIPYKVNIVEIPLSPSNANNVLVCSDANIPPLTVMVEQGYTANWYDSLTGGNLLQENSTTYRTTISGTYYAEAKHPIVNCINTTRVPVTISINESPIVADEDLQFCKDEPFTISAGIDNVTYSWSTGADMKEIVIENPGIYTVEVKTPEGCPATKTIAVSNYENPVIDTITTNFNDIVVALEQEGDFEFSLDDINYQNSNIFRNIEGGLYTIYVRNGNGCTPVEKNHIHIEIPFFFTPNGDNSHELLVFNGLENFPSSFVSIYDRYGNLIVSGNGNSFSWDGTFNGVRLPSADYWYNIIINNSISKKGHFALKR